MKLFSAKEANRKSKECKAKNDLVKEKQDRKREKQRLKETKAYIKKVVEQQIIDAVKGGHTSTSINFLDSPLAINYEMVINHFKALGYSIERLTHRYATYIISWGDEDL